MTPPLLPFASAAPGPLWLSDRAAGTCSLVLLTATVALGAATGGRHAPRSAARFEITALHRNLSVLTLLFLAVHVTTAVADTFAHLGWFIAFVPFTADYRTVWLSLGTIASDILLAVTATSAFRLRLGRRRWKAVHWTAYAAWPVALLHAAGTGTDLRLAQQLFLHSGCLAVVVGTCWWRIARAGPGRVLPRLALAAATLIVPVGISVFVATGPLQPGWSHRATGPVHGPVTPDGPGSAG